MPHGGPPPFLLIATPIPVAQLVYKAPVDTLYLLTLNLLCIPFLLLVINWLDPIEELYDIYSEEEDTLRIVEIEDDGLDFVSDVEGPADPYMDL